MGFMGVSSAGAGDDKSFPNFRGEPPSPRALLPGPRVLARGSKAEPWGIPVGRLPITSGAARLTP